MGNHRKNSRCLDESDDEQLFHSKFTSERSTNCFTYDEANSLSFYNKKFNNLNPKKRMRLSSDSDNEINNNNECDHNCNNFDGSSIEKSISQDFVLNNDNNSNCSEETDDFIPKCDNIPIPSISIKLKEIVIGNYNNLNPGSLFLNPSANSICIKLQSNNNLDRIDFHVKGIKSYNRKEQNVIRLNLVHDWVKYLLPAREVSLSGEIKIKINIDPTEGELRRVGCIKLFPDNSVNIKDLNAFGQEFRKMKISSKPPISPILQWKEKKFEVIVNYNRRQRYLFVMEETTIQEFLVIVQKKFNSPRINLPFRYLLDEPEVIHISSEESWKTFKLVSFHRQSQDFNEKKSLVLYLKDNMD